MRTVLITAFALAFAFVGSLSVRFFERWAGWQKKCAVCERGTNCTHDPNWKEHCPNMQGEAKP